MFDHELAAKEDIVNRPEPTGKAEDVALKMEPEAAKKPLQGGDFTIEPDQLEQAASKVISKAFDDARELLGAGRDGDLVTLMTEALGGIFAGLRSMSGRPWVRFAVAGGALGVSLIIPFWRYHRKKTTEETDK